MTEQVGRRIGGLEVGQHQVRTIPLPQVQADLAVGLRGREGPLEVTEVVVEGDTARVYPIEASADTGSVTIEMAYKKDPDGVWRILALNIESI